MMTNLGHSMLLTLFFLIILWGFPVLIILSLTYICRNSEKAIDRTFGLKAEIYAGWLGIIIHEASHWLLAKVFNHKILEVKLLILPWQVDMRESQPKLGYVRHAYSDYSIYQSLGNAFIGTAPIYGCTAVLYLIYRYMTPNLYTCMSNIVHIFSSEPSKISLTYFISLVKNSLNFSVEGIVMGLLSFYLITNITLTGFDLSDADLKNAKPAGLMILAILVVIIFPMTYFGLEVYIFSIVAEFLELIIAIFLPALINTLLVNILSHAFYFFLKA